MTDANIVEITENINYIVPSDENEVVITKDINSVIVDQIQNFVIVSASGVQGVAGAGGAELGTSFPADPTDGMFFYNTDTATLYLFNSVEWVAIGQGIITYRLLAENNYILTTENNLGIMQE
jgi:hypothetical protein